MSLLAFIAGFAAVIGLTLGTFLIGTVFERLSPAEPGQTLADLRLNLGYSLVSNLFLYVVMPTLTAGTALLLNWAGAGLIHLPDAGWQLIFSIAIYLLAMDFLDYLFHCAQHRWPPLWAMHSFHHSDRAMNITTTQRNFWLEPVLKTLFLFPLVPLLFQVPAPAVAAFALCGYIRLFSHMNLNWSLGPLWVVVIGPQFHRIHHSILPEHRDKNFAPLFPIFDILFRTHFRPRPGEFPPTGLDTGEAPESLATALVWPWRN
ncbi:MAG TPA: sterol desaturase family protein [Stellaceae bacterium]|nr:sterol desaturase family protein [Stellaceae bacterium]